MQKQMEKMPQLIDQYRARLSKSAELECKQEEKKRVIIEEARDFFGYRLDVNDPRIEQMREQKEEQEKQMKRKKKKEEKLTRITGFIDKNVGQ